ncbi:MAG: putative rRNA maturation factor [Parcubacteria group bacterium Gr01-1014_29]|nr:MAG: putative rRNA maturation factor [Parcubacteria group bacterium Gr01-1014_29]
MPLGKKTGSLAILNKTAKHIPRSLLERVFCIASKKHTMEVSVVFLGDEATRVLNNMWRKIDKRANVLAFRLDTGTGEVVINPYEAERESRRLGMPYTERVLYLFLHGLLHLYGYDHHTKKDANRMERKEKEYMQVVFTGDKLYVQMSFDLETPSSDGVLKKYIR